MTLESLAAGIDTVWILLAAALVFFMQAGFCLVEGGLTRAKNVGNIIMKNLMDFVLGSIVFWLIGFAFMHGKSVLGGIIAVPDASTGAFSSTLDMQKLFFQTVFAATAATIVSGAMAERTKFSCYCLYSVIISLVIYPISGHWIWGGGWLAQLGFHDYAGSTAVHFVGGLSAFIGALILGPRIGKYDKTKPGLYNRPMKDAKPRAIPGHNLMYAALGVFLLWFCWFGFNGGSSYGVFNADGNLVITAMARSVLTTNLAAVGGAAACLIVTWIRYKKPDVSMCLNGVLAGLVAVTAGAVAVNPAGALLIGIIAGVVVVFAVEFLDKKIKVDDPVGAIAVHGVCGALGTILVGIFADNNADAGVPGLWGILSGANTAAEGFKQLGLQVLGVVTVAAWVGLTMTGVFMLLKKTLKLRVSREDEIAGLDPTEHNLATAYAGFSIMDLTEGHGYTASPETLAITENHPAVPAAYKLPVEEKDAKMTKISMVIKQDKFDALKNALNRIGVTGMTVTQVMGFGVQKGQTELYRSAPVELKLLPKVKVEVIVSLVPVEDVIETAKRVLYTGNIGDGKIFTYDVEHVVRVRTGEEDFAALQDTSN
jgi:Amt family ammonium transporter